MNSMIRVFVLTACLAVTANAFAIIQPTTCPSLAPAIDGAFSPLEWDSAYTVDLQVNLPEGSSAPARIYVMNDAQSLYVALRIKRAAPDPASTFFITLDANHDGRLSAGDDAFGISHSPQEDIVADDVYYMGGTCPPGVLCGALDTNRGGTNDVIAAFGYDGGYMTYEFAKPLMIDDPNDAAMSPASPIGMAFSVRLFSATNHADTYYPTNPNGTFGINYLISDCGPAPY